ncbi:MAG: hypothetical protein ACJAWV_003672 [Flammeovirgaceae bacterium]|jgi:hypothetical protein
MARQTRKPKNIKFTIAIIGEGETEWHYFDDLKSVERYTYKISPDLPKHSDFADIFRKAEEKAEEGYNKVYCVIDLDIFKENEQKNQSYQKAKRKILKKHSKVVSIIETMPCIEYWFLLHFENFSTKIYPSYESLKSKLTANLEGYEKTRKYFEKVKLYTTLVEKGDLESAKICAKKLREYESDNKLIPFTDIDTLLEELKSYNGK